jgi:hypothetical protein
VAMKINFGLGLLCLSAAFAVDHTGSDGSVGHSTPNVAPFGSVVDEMELVHNLRAPRASQHWLLGGLRTRLHERKFQNRFYVFKKGFTTVTLPYCCP